VIDFGIARAADASMLTQAGTIMGSPGFLSPEQAEGREVGPPSDVFSLGAVLAFAACGEGPFGPGTAASLVYRVVNAAPNLSAVPGQLRPVIERCLAKDPAGRPTAGELLASFGAAQRAPEWLPPQVAVPPAGPATPVMAGESAEYQARTQTHVTPTLPRPAAGATPPGRADGGTTPAWGPGGPAAPAGPIVTDSGRTSRRGNRGLLVLIVAGAVVLAAASAGIALAVSSHPAAPSAAPPVTRPAVPPAPASPALARTSPAPAETSPAAASSPTAPAGSAVVGVWTGTYTCNQGLSGMRLTITGSGGDTLRATVEFYAVAGNPSVPDGSYVLTGDYSASGGLVLIPDYWINEPAGYEMVGLSGPAPSGNSMHGRVQGVNCTTFSVTR
jgi:hypothetical protein